MGLSDSSFMSGGLRLGDFIGQHAIQIVEVSEGPTPNKKVMRTLIKVNVANSSCEAIKMKIAANDGQPLSAELSMFLPASPQYHDYYYTEQRLFLGKTLGLEPADNTVPWQAHMDAAKAQGTLNGKIMLAEVYDSGKVIKSGENMGNAVLKTNWERPPAPAQA